jgi:hypothetical protein
MLKNLPVYTISIDLENPDTTVSMNSMVLDPAHELSFQLFHNQKLFHFNKKENVITGVAISADTPIYRYDDKSKEEYYVVFTKQAIKDIIFDYARRGNFNNVNLDHSARKVVDDAYMIHSYQIDEEKGFTAPERFKDVNDGSWIVSYKVSDEIFAKAEAGEWTGFSVEGVFQMEESDISIEDKMWSAISKELTEIYHEFAGMRISFDYDDTLTTSKGQQMASRYVAAKDNVFIVTARQQSNGGPVYEMAKKLGIKRENVYFTGGRDKWQTIKRLRINKHIDNNQEQIDLIKENTDAEAIKF